MRVHFKTNIKMYKIVHSPRYEGNILFTEEEVILNLERMVNTLINENYVCIGGVQIIYLEEGYITAMYQTMLKKNN